MKREEQSIREANLRYPDSPERGYGTGDYEPFEDLSNERECFVEGVLWADEHPKEGMVDIEKVKDWLFENFSEWTRDGDYDYGKPYLESRFDTLEEMIDDFDKKMEVE